MNVVELFSGIGSQKKALVNLKIPHNVLMTSEWEISAIIGYAILHCKEKYNGEYDHLSKIEIIKILVKDFALSMDGKNLASSKSLNTFSLEILRVLLFSINISKNFTSVTKISGKNLMNLNKKIDVLTYSFPCQDLSNVGNFHRENLGIDRDANNKSSLLWEVERILFELRDTNAQMPKVLLMENVKSILAPRHRDNFNEWKNNLKELGYYNHVYKLESSMYGVPQKRTRVFMISIYINADVNLKDKLEKYFYENDLEKKELKNKISLRKILKLNKSNDKIYNEWLEAMPNKTPSRNNIWKDNKKLVLNGEVMIKHVQTITTKQDRHPNSGVIEFENYFRYLTPRECFLLMGFTDEDYDKLLNSQMVYRVKSKLFSNERLYRLAGNSIVVNVLELIFEQIKEILCIIEEK